MLTNTRSEPPDEAHASPVVSVIVVSYNTCPMTLECLRSIEDQTTVPYELIVVDNASPDGSAGAIEKRFPAALVMAESSNHGFAIANNIASRRATAPYLLLLNPDTVVLDHAIDRLVASARAHPEARIWGGRTRFADGTLNPSSCWRRMTLWSLLCRVSGLDRMFAGSPVFNPEAYGGWERDTERRVDIVSGCFFLIERELWDRLGGFDARYVMYGEEADLCMRAHRLSARPLITPSAEIVHHGGASETVRSDKLVRLLRAKLTLVPRVFPRWQQPIARWLLRAWPASRVVASSVLVRLSRAGARDHVRSTWQSVWSDRSLWWTGYPPADREDDGRGDQRALFGSS